MTGRRQKPDASGSRDYALEQLFNDQDHDWVVDTIAPVLAWVNGSGASQPYSFLVEHSQGQASATIQVNLSWNLKLLATLVPDVAAHAQRLRNGRSVQREHVTELAAYGLTFVAVSLLMPGRRVVSMQMGVAPDILFDVTPGHLRGVETAGRTAGGRSALMAVRDGPKSTKRAPGNLGKAAVLLARLDLDEIHLALWSAKPRLGIMEQLRP